MSRSLRRGAIAALVLAAIVPLSACAAGTSPDTVQVTPDNQSTSIGTDLKLNNILVVTPVGASSDVAGPVSVSVNIANTGEAPESLKSVSVGGTSATFTDANGAPLTEIVIPARGSVLLSGPGQPAAHVSSVKVPVAGYAPTSFTFGRAGSVTANAAVKSATGQYAAFGPSAAPTVLPSVSASASVSAAPSVPAGASVSPSAGASTSPSPALSVSPAAATASASAKH